MKSYKQFMEGHKTCPKGEYYCYTDKKCKKIPGGYHVGRGGYLERDDNNDSEETNGSKNGSSNGSNGSNGNGNGGNGNGGNGGGGE